MAPLSRLLHGVVWSTLATGVTSGFNLLAGIVVARDLGKAAFGQIGIIQSTVGFIALLAGLGLGTTATALVARQREQNPSRCGAVLGTILTFGITLILVSSLALFVLAPWVGRLVFGSSGMETAIRVAALWVFGFATGELLLAALAGLQAFKSVAATSLFRGTAVFFGVILGLRWGATGVLIGWSVALILSALVLWQILVVECRRHVVRLVFGEVRAHAQEVIGYAVPTLISGLTYAPFVWFTNVLITRAPAGLEEMALLNAAYQWRAIFTYLPVSISRAVLPLLSSSAAADTPAAFAASNFINQLAVWGCGISLLGASGMILWFYGEGFAPGLPVLVAVMGGAMVGYVGNSLGSLIQARGLFRLGIAGNLLSGVILTLFTLWLAKELGSLAVGLGSLAGYLANLILCAYSLGRRAEVGPRLARKIVFSSLAAAALVVVLLLLPPQSAWLAVFLVPVAIAGVWFLFGQYEGVAFGVHNLLALRRAR